MVGMDSDTIAVEGGNLAGRMLILGLGAIFRIRSVRACAVRGT
jgi:hypothetical protein